MISTLKLSAAEHPIKSVTVFKSKAEVVRTFALELKVSIKHDLFETCMLKTVSV
jgi:hypothetical protein